MIVEWDSCLLLSRYNSRVYGETHRQTPRYQREPLQNQIQLFYSSFDTVADLEMSSPRYVVTDNLSFWVFSLLIESSLSISSYPWTTCSDVWRKGQLSPRGSSSTSKLSHWRRRRGKMKKGAGRRRKRPVCKGRKWRSSAWTPMFWFGTTGAWPW